MVSMAATVKNHLQCGGRLSSIPMGKFRRRERRPQYFGLENSTEWLVHGVAKSRDVTEKLSLSQAIRDVFF